MSEAEFAEQMALATAWVNSWPKEKQLMVEDAIACPSTRDTPRKPVINDLE